MQPKTFTVKLNDGTLSEAVQITTLTHAVNGRVFRFVVTMLEGYDVSVTHRPSGMAVVRIPPTLSTSTQARAKESAREALDSLIRRVGAEKVASVLSAAE